MISDWAWAWACLLGYCSQLHCPIFDCFIPSFFPAMRWSSKKLRNNSIEKKTVSATLHYSFLFHLLFGLVNLLSNPETKRDKVKKTKSIVTPNEDGKKKEKMYASAYYCNEIIANVNKSGIYGNNDGCTPGRCTVGHFRFSNSNQMR